MMRVLTNPQRQEWPELTRRPAVDFWNLMETVRNIFVDIRENGDGAVIKYGREFDRVELTSLMVTEGEIAEAESKVSQQLKDAIGTAMANIENFHRKQQTESMGTETSPGIICSVKSMPIEKVGLYVPGGSAPLFSTVLMLAVPAYIAGCSEIVLCTPPDSKGEINPAILYAARKARVSRIYKAGGIQAIAAMSIGTSTIPQVYKIFGPGNQYVTAAKQYASICGTAIDMPAGPSEVAVIADGTSNPDFIAADLLAQAEHGVDSQVVLLTDSSTVAQKVQEALKEQLPKLPRCKIAERVLENSFIIIFDTLDRAIDFSNLYAPEHLIIEMTEYQGVESKITNAGSVFLGHYAPESAGDYATGANHTLPTNGYARAYSGLNLDSFLHKITFQQISAEGLLGLASTITTMAENEKLDAHSNAVKIRFNKNEYSNRTSNQT